MSMVPCPGCGAPMDLEQEVCGACRRPRDHGEIEAAKDALEQARLARARRPWVLLRSLVAFGVVAFAFANRGPMIEWVTGAASRFADEVEKARGEGSETLPPPGAAASAPAADLAPSPSAVSEKAHASAPAALLVPVAAANPKSSPQLDGGMVVEPDEPPVLDAEMRGFYGAVFDAVTFRPVAGARLFFQNLEGKEIRAIRIDGSGHYFLQLEASLCEDGVRIVSDASGYVPGQFMDPDPSLLARETAARRDFVEQLAPSDLRPIIVRGPRTNRWISVNLGLVPEGSRIARPASD